MVRKTETAQAAEHLKGIAEDEDRLPRRPVEWCVLMVLAAVVGAMTGVVGGAFRIALVELSKAREEMIARVQVHGFGWMVAVVVCAAGAGIACYLTQRFAPADGGERDSARGGGGARSLAAVRSADSSDQIYWRRFEHWKWAGAGARRGPTVQMGGTIGRLTSDGLKRWLPEPWTLVAAGAGAGLAVAFNAPLAAVIFVVEELLRRFSARVFSATLMACIMGTVVLRLMLGNAMDFQIPQVAELPSGVLPSYLVLGLLAGFVGVAFNTGLMATLRLSDRATGWPRGAKGALVGATAGLLAWFVPGVVGGGEKIAQSAIVTEIPWMTLGALLVARFVLTLASYGSGAPGGIFAPLLVLGALTGSGFAAAETSLFHQPHDPAPVCDRGDGGVLHVDRPLAADGGGVVAGNDRNLAADFADDGGLDHGVCGAGVARKSADL